MIDLSTLTIKKAREALMRGDFTATELFQAYQKHIAEKNPELNAYLETFSDLPENIDVLAKEGKLPLAGIPISVKDNILIKGHIASASSKMLENHIAAYDSTVIKLLKEAGAVFLGRTNMDEFALGGSTENSAFGPTKNPHDITRVPGGTSGGSAATVAADIALASLGSDTGGSIRQPSSFCGVVGLKPTYGGVSRFGLIAAASSLDQIGPITKTVTDAEIVWTVISSHDPLDAQSVPIKDRHIDGGSKKKIGIPKGFDWIGSLSADVKENFERAVSRLKELGYDVIDVDMPHLALALPSYYIVNFAEVSSNLARLDGIRYGFRSKSDSLWDLYVDSRASFGLEVKRRILLGAYVLSSGYYDAFYGKALAVRELVKNDFMNAFASVDAIITPVAPTAAFKIGEKNDPLSLYVEDLFTVPANLAGIPALSVPSGKGEDGMPIGIQFQAPWFGEPTLFEIGKKFLGEE
jgi:aspartyl-tRNA(Asn)/glutamyl-tRNA(Gln) amidotransferase subunit A